MGGLVLGLLVGMRHALEADHVAAVAALTQRSRGFRSALRLGAAWGIGHTLTLFAAGTIVLSLDGVMPEQIARIFEFAVGIMLVLLGADLLRRLIVARVHVHIHRHGDGTTHFHAHSHAGEADHTSSRHDHVHVRGARAGAGGGADARPRGVGGVDPAQIDSLFWALAYLALFGIGSMIGMAALSVVIVAAGGAEPLMGAQRAGRGHSARDDRRLGFLPDRRRRGADPDRPRLIAVWAALRPAIAGKDARPILKC